MKRIGACLLLIVLSICLAVPAFAWPKDRDHAAQKSEKLREKRWKKFVNRQKKADKKAQKRVKEINKRSDQRLG